MHFIERHMPTKRIWRGMQRSIVGVCVALSACAGDPPQQAGTQDTQQTVSVEQPAPVLPSWRDGPARAAIVTFIANVTREGSSTYVPPEARVAVFDNDGTLWSEQPMPFQLYFMIDQMKAAAPRHPEWKTNAAYKALLHHDYAALDRNRKALLQLISLANSGMTTDEYDGLIHSWLSRAKHPSLDRRYTDLVYQPQLELLDLLRANGFRIWIVSGGTTQFMRAWASKAYGIPPENVVGTEEKLKYEIRGGKPVLVRKPGLAFVDDGAGKPVGIYRAIGRRPILAFGNSDSDRQMLAYTASGPGTTLAVVLRHDDAVREFAYDRQSPMARLDKVLDKSVANRGWSSAWRATGRPSIPPRCPSRRARSRAWPRSPKRRA